MRQGKRHITYDSTHQLVSAANAQTYALSVTYGDWGKIQEYGLSQTDLASNTTTSQTRNYGYGSLNEGQTTFAPNNISYADGTNVNEQYGIGGSLLRRETNIPGNQPNEELYRFGADGNMRLYSYDRLFFALYGYDGGTTRTYKYSFDLNPNWVNGRLESVNFNPHNAMFYPNNYLNFNANGYYTKHYYNGMERIASRLGDQNLPINVNDPDLQDRKDQLDSNIRRNIVDITGYEFLPVGEEQTIDDPKPIFELPVIGISNLQPSSDGIYYYHPNHLGSTCYVTDGNASVQQGFLYAPFGEITNEYNSGWQSGNIPKYAFNAKELDEETGFYYYEARYYNPPTFISRDVLFEEKPWFTPYHYCSNNPVVRIDPTGMMDWHPEITENGEVNYVADKGDSKESFQRQYNVSKAAVDKIFKNAGISEVKKGTRISGAIVSKSITNNTGRKYDDVLKLNWNKATKEQKVYHVMFAILCSNIRRGNEESDVIDLNEFINGLPSETGDPANLSIKNVTIPLPDDKTMKLQIYNSSFSKKYSRIVSQPPNQFSNSDGTLSFNQTFVQFPFKGSGIPRITIAFPAIYYDSYIKYYY